MVKEVDVVSNSFSVWVWPIKNLAYIHCQFAKPNDIQQQLRLLGFVCNQTTRSFFFLNDY
jgi:hypothetical protein